MPDLRVLVIGSGGMGGVHLSRWANVSGATVTAVCDTDAATAMRAATEFGAEAHTHWREAIKSGCANVVDICTPTSDHAAITMTALDAGMHVLCETPGARTLDEAKAIAEKAANATGVYMPAYCHRFHPPLLFARELIDNDDLGRIVMFRMRLSDQLSEIADRWITKPAIAGPGILTDVTVHSVDLFRALVGDIKEANGQTTTVNLSLSTPDSAVLCLQAVNGSLGVIESSWSTPGGQNTLELYGTAGACIVDYDTNRVRYKTADMVVWHTQEIGGSDRFQRLIAHFADVVRGLQSPVLTANDGLQAMAVISALA